MCLLCSWTNLRLMIFSMMVFLVKGVSEKLFVVFASVTNAGYIWNCVAEGIGFWTIRHLV